MVQMAPDSPRFRGLVPSVVLAFAALALALVIVWRVHGQAQQPGFSIPAGAIIHDVALNYGERHPRVLLVERTYTDPSPQEPMYSIRLAGHFHRGRASADELYISTLADRHFIWGIAGYQGHGRHRRSVWTDCQDPCTGRLVS